MIDINDYKNFVDSVTSLPSKDHDVFIETMNNLRESGVDVPRALTACVGLSGEVGEFNDIFKKVFFQGKSYSDETKKHLTKELGDVIFYWIDACIAIGVDPMEVMNGNFEKLRERYPGGFSVEKSEKRNSSDI